MSLKISREEWEDPSNVSFFSYREMFTMVGVIDDYVEENGKYEPKVKEILIGVRKRYVDHLTEALTEEVMEEIKNDPSL